MKARHLPAIACLAVCCSLLGLGRPASATTRHMFVSSTSGTANLGAWPRAGSATGLAAGDAICQSLATDAGLADATGYRAWLSSATTDAFCHVQGFTGQRANNCGQASLPTAAGPWRRVDGTNFGASIVELLAPSLEVFLPPRIDENGNVHHALVWTGTDSSGAAGSGTCSNWTTASAGANGNVFGATDATSWTWASSGTTDCAEILHLLCFERGAGDPLPPPATWGRLAFVSSVSRPGDLGSWPEADGATGIDAGDAICGALATAAGLREPESFKAWLSDSSVDARDRFQFDGPWVRLDRTRIATGLADLTDGFLHAPINLTETGSYLSNDSVWTGSTADGLAAADTCSDWTSLASPDQAPVGAANFSSSRWSDYFSAQLCNQNARLYCLQDLPLVFEDDFESGNTAVWSAASP